jgi:predicted lipoprotein
VVDNTIREAIGVKASDFANSQDFNAVSSELNRRVEQEVIAPNRAFLKVGMLVDFVGCAKIGGKSDLDPLGLIPIQLQTRGSEDANAGLDKDTATGTTP